MTDRRNVGARGLCMLDNTAVHTNAYCMSGSSIDQKDEVISQIIKLNKVLVQVSLGLSPLCTANSSGKNFQGYTAVFTNYVKRTGFSRVYSYFRQ